MSISRRILAHCKCPLLIALALTLALVIPRTKACGQPAADAAAAAEAEAAAEPSKYVSFEVNDDLRTYGTASIPRMLKVAGEIDARFDKYFVSYFFARMTQPDALQDITKLRDKLEDYFQQCARNTDVMNRLNNLTYQLMYGICLGPAMATDASGKQFEVIKVGANRYLNMRGEPVGRVRLVRTDRDFHPAVKYNAMLIIGDLNDKQATRRTAAIPKGSLLDPLLKFAADRKRSDSLRVAALIGVKRHSKVKDLADGVKELIANTMLTILKQGPQPGRSPDGEIWLRRQAIDVLAELAIPGANNAVVKQLVLVMGSEDIPLPLRAAAAEALGRIQIGEVPEGEIKIMADHVGHLAVELCRYEMEGGPSRREPANHLRLLAYLNSIQVALDGPQAAEPADEEADGEEAESGRGLVAIAKGDDKIICDQLSKSVRRVAGVAGDAGDGLRLAPAGPLNQLVAVVEGKPAGAAGDVGDDGDDGPAVDPFR